MFNNPKDNGMAKYDMGEYITIIAQKHAITLENRGKKSPKARKTPK